MNNRADETIKNTLVHVLARHFEGRPYGHLGLLPSAREGDLRGAIAVNHHRARDDIVEFRAELRLSGPLDQERRLMDRMLEAIDFLHEAGMDQNDQANRAADDPIIIGISFETASFERMERTDQASACLIFNVRTTTD